MISNKKKVVNIRFSTSYKVHRFMEPSSTCNSVPINSTRHAEDPKQNSWLIKLLAFHFCLLLQKRVKNERIETRDVAAQQFMQRPPSFHSIPI